MVEKYKSFNYHFYKNILFNNNHQNLVLNYFPLSTKEKKIKLTNKSQSCIFPFLDTNNENNKEKNTNIINEIKNKKIIDKATKTKNNQDIFGSLNKSLSIYDNFSDIKIKIKNEEENDINRKNNINKSYYYQSICLGKEIDRNKIDNLNSPLLKYFLYNIFQNNKRNIKLNKRNISLKKRSTKNFNLYNKPNFFLMNKNNNIFYHKSDEKQKLRNMISKNIIIKSKINKKKGLNSEEDSSSENNQIDSSDIKKVLKIEERNENLKINLKSKETNFSSFFKSSNFKKLALKKFKNPKLNKIKNIKINIEL